MKSRHFTLMELLIVIMIIALLASMLLPALKRSKDFANSILCKSNLKQLGVSSLLYWNDHNEIMFLTKNPSWSENLMDDILGSENHVASMSDSYQVKWKKFKNSILVCPSSVYIRAQSDPPSYANGMKTFYHNMEDNYAMNHTVFSLYNNRNSLPLRLGKISKPSTLLLYYDSIGDISQPMLRHGSPFDDRNGVGILTTQWVPSNPGRANLVFIDGHIDDGGYSELNNTNQPPWKNQ